MKKIVNLSAVILLLCIMFGTMPAQAQDCSKLTTAFVKTLDKIGVDIKRCNTLDEISDLDFEGLSEKYFQLELDDIDASCLYTQLTPTDKKKLKSGFNTFFDNMINRMAEIYGSDELKQAFQEDVQPMKQQYYQMIDASDSFYELMELMGEAEF